MAKVIVRFQHKLKSTAGFMLAEQLLSVIFIGLLCLMVAAGMNAALQAYNNITQQTQAQALLNRTVQEVSDELAFAKSGLDENNEFASTSVHANVQLTNGSIDGAQGVVLIGEGIQSGVTQDDGNNETVLLIPGSGDLYPQLEGLTYEEKDGKQLWTFTVNIVRAGSSTADPVATSGPMTVKRIGS